MAFFQKVRLSDYDWFLDQNSGYSQEKNFLRNNFFKHVGKKKINSPQILRNVATYSTYF